MNARGDLGVGRRFEDRVSVRAAETESVYASARRLTVRFRPGLRLACDPQPQIVEGDLRVRILEVQGLGNLAMLQTQRRLDQAGDSRGRLQMSHIALDRPDHATIIGLSCLAVYRSERGSLDRIAHRRSGPVRLDILHALRCDLGEPQGFDDVRLLRGLVGNRDARGATILVDRRRADDSVDAIAIGQCARERLENEYAGAFAAHVAISAGIEALAPPVRREHRGLGEPDCELGSQRQIHAADECQFAFSVPDTAAAQMGGDERGRARGIDGETGADQIEEI